MFGRRLERRRRGVGVGNEIAGRRIASEAGGRNLTYGLVETLGRAIVTGHYADAQFPTEGELARLHTVSRSVTREAVKMLTAKGRRTARPRKGTTVQPARCWNLFGAEVLRWLLERKFSLELLRQFAELRLAIEPATAALAAKAADADGLGGIAAGYARMEAAEGGGDDPLESDIAFHIALLHASANPSPASSGTWWRQRFAHRSASPIASQGRTASLSQHQAVLAAVAARDPERAKAAMEGLILDVMRLVEDAEAER